MPNWKNRTMMMNSGGSVSRPTMTDFFEQGYANLGSEKNPDTYYNDNRRSDRNIDDLRKLMQNHYYDKISSGSDIGSIKEQINKIEKMKRKGKNLNQNLDYGPFSGSLSADENSITARANVGKGIFELLRDKDSGDNSASYRRGNYLLSGSESGRKSLDYRNGPFYGSAFTGDKRLGDGVRAGMKLRFSKGGPVQGFANGGKVTDRFKDSDINLPLEDRFGEGQFILPDMYKGYSEGIFNMLAGTPKQFNMPGPLGPDLGDYYTEGPYVGRKKSPLRRLKEDPRFAVNRKKSLPGYQLHEAAAQLQETKKRLKEIQFSLDNKSFSLNPKRRKQLENMRDQLTKDIQMGGENLFLLAQPVITAMDNEESLSPEGIEAMRNSTIAENGLVTDPATLLGVETPDMQITESNSDQIAKNIEDATSVDEVVESITEIKQDPVSSEEVDSETSSEQTESEQTEEGEFAEYLNGIRDEAKINEDKELKELAIRSSASYSPEAQRAGQVSSMYGQIAPGQIGGMGASLARGAFAAENKQQELDKTQAAYEEALAVQSSKNQSDLRKERLKIQAELLKDATTAARDGRYNTSTTQLPLPKIGNEEINILLRTPKNAELGLPNMPVPESIAFALTTANNYLGNIEYSIQGMNKLKKFSQKSGGLKGLIGQKAEQIGNIFGVTVDNPSARISQENFGDLMALGLAKFLLEEGGKTISNQEREMVKQTLGAPGLTKGAAEMATQINNIIQRLSNVKAGAENVLVSLESQYPDEVNRQLKIINSSKEDKDKLAAISVKDIG